MRDAVASVAFLGAVLLVWVLRFDGALADDTPLGSSDDNPQVDDLAKRDWNKDLHIWGKRAWSNLHNGWGKRSAPDEEKRAWSNLHSGWGKRHAITVEDAEGLRRLLALLQNSQIYQLSPSRGYQNNFGTDYDPYYNANPNYNIPGLPKCWDCLGGVWGRSASADDFNSGLPSENDAPQVKGWGRSGPADDFNGRTPNENDVPQVKGWGDMKGSWGKRSSKWDNFRGAWGKREPAWSNLKGIWGKRSQNQIAQ